MKGTSIASEAHRQYGEMVTAFRRFIPDPALRMKFSRQIDPFVRRCVLGVWQSDGAGAVSERHVAFYEAIQSARNPVQSTLLFELATQVAEYDLFQPPAFYGDLILYDKCHGTTLARRFADQLTLILLLFAAADGAVSEGEAGFVNACADTLLRLCAEKGLSGHHSVNASDFITKATPAQPPKAPSPGSPCPPKAPSGPPDPVCPAPEPAPVEMQEKEQAAAAPEPTLEELMGELDALCGLERVKKDVKSLVNLVKVRRLRQEAGLPAPALSLHLVFLGNPGTGKTTVARLLAKIYKAIGVLSRGQLVEVDRSGLVAGYVGQTAVKTQEAIQRAMGGVLFIDEAYALASRDSASDFGGEAIEVLLKNMEDHRDDLIVIVAGYTGPMEKFIHANPGLESRFNKYFFFEDYDAGQLLEIFRSQCSRNGYTLSEEAEEWAKDRFALLYAARDENFGNAREVRNLFEKAVARQADRVALLENPTKEQLMELTKADLEEPDDRRKEAAGI